MGWFILLFSLAVACEKDINQPIIPPKIPDSTQYKNTPHLIIACEGNYTWANASLTSVQLNSGTVIQQVYKQANGKPLGDVAQHVVAVGEYLYVVVNNSGAILKLRGSDFKEVARRDDFPSPRYLLPLGDGTALLSDMGNNALLRIKLEDLSTLSSERVQGWIEQMSLCKGVVYACNVRNNQIETYDVQSSRLMNPIPVGRQPQWICTDSTERVWVLCDGGLPGATKEPPRIYEISTSGKSVAGFNEVGERSENAMRLVWHSLREELMFLSGGLKVFSVLEKTVTLRVPAQGRNFYGLFVGSTGEIFLTDAGDYVTAGKVCRYSGGGAWISEYDAGQIPQSMVIVDKLP